MRLHMSFFFCTFARKTCNEQYEKTIFVYPCSLLFVPSLQQRGPSKKGHWSFNVPIE